MGSLTSSNSNKLLSGDAKAFRLFQNAMNRNRSVLVQRIQNPGLWIKLIGCNLEYSASIIRMKNNMLWKPYHSIPKVADN